MRHAAHVRLLWPFHAKAAPTPLRQRDSGKSVVGRPVARWPRESGERLNATRSWTPSTNRFEPRKRWSIS